MDETYRMLGREREADFEREAAKRRLAQTARTPRRGPRIEERSQRRRWRAVTLRLAGLVTPNRA